MEISKIPYSNNDFGRYLIRIGDLVNFEGPIISLFEDFRNGHLFIFEWIDRTATGNLWIVYQVTSEAVWKFIKKQDAYDRLFLSNPSNYYHVEISGGIRNKNLTLIPFETLPNKYYPEKDNYFDMADCPDYDKLLSFVLKRLENRKQENILPNHFILFGRSISVKVNSNKFERLMQFDFHLHHSIKAFGAQSQSNKFIKGQTVQRVNKYKLNSYA